MLRHQKGYICNGYTFIVNKEDVHNATDDMFVEATALLPVPDIVTNADRIRAMSDDDGTDDPALLSNYCPNCGAKMDLKEDAL